MAMSKEEQKKRWKEQYAKKKEQRLYQKILNDDLFTITDVANIFNKKTSTIRRWEAEGLIPKVKKYAKNEEYADDEMHTRRKYTKEELYEVISNVLNKDWSYNTIDRDNLEKIKNYLELQINITNTQRTREKPMYYT